MKPLIIETNLEELKLLISELEKVIEKINSFEIKFTVKPS
jgi:hypothetical protein